MIEVVGEAWRLSFTVPQIKASFKWVGQWPVDMTRAINRLQRAGSKKKARPYDRPPLVGFPSPISVNELIASLGPRSVRNLNRGDRMVTGGKIGT